VCLLVQLVVEILTGISLPPECEIGPGLYIGHFGPVILNSGVRLGRNCNLSQGVTLGVAGRGTKRGCPIIGDRVYIGVNAVLIGPIEVGNDVAIGAGAVLTKSVAACAVVAGNPACVISHKGSFDFVQYDRMDVDSARSEALTLSELRSTASVTRGEAQTLAVGIGNNRACKTSGTRPSIMASSQ
jgi:serine acetyltransferase